jgi:hypothetical protein
MASDKTGGGPAFARTLSKEEREAHALQGCGPAPFGHEGMTLRDYFAAKAMQGLLSQSMVPTLGSDQKYAAEYAYAMADAMLVARGRS